MPDSRRLSPTSPRWLTDERDPRKPPWKRGGLPYLGEPNYYRMAYQLAVELVEGSARGFKGPQAPDPEAIVERLIEDANLMLGWYKRREYLGEGQFWKRLEPPEERLRDFLTKTILPCLEILRANIGHGRFDETEAAKVEVRLQMLRRAAEDGRLSYRPLYNLACYEAMRDQVRPAVQYLIDALHKAPSSRKAGLLARAENDMALKRVVTDVTFEAKRKVFDPSLQKPPKPRGWQRRFRRFPKIDPGRG
jgi:hypothetical protein